MDRGWSRACDKRRAGCDKEREREKKGERARRWKKRGAKRKFPPLRGSRSDAESIRVIVSRGGNSGRGLNRLAESGRREGGREGEEEGVN